MSHLGERTQSSFVETCAQRGGFVLWILAINAIILTAYVLYFYTGTQPGHFWLVGMGITLIVCGVASAVTLLVIIVERVRSRRAQRRARMWADAMPYKPGEQTAPGVAAPPEPGKAAGRRRAG